MSAIFLIVDSYKHHIVPNVYVKKEILQEIRLLRSWVRIPPGHECLSVVSVVCCQVEVSATS